MRYLLALVPFALVATLSAQNAVFIGGTQPPAPPWDAPHLEFEVVSVKTNKSGPTMMMMRTLPTSFNVTNVPLRLLITQAYRLSNYQMVGGPSWIDSERFDIIAKAPEGSSPDQTMLMLRGLLAQRFRLKVHAETREVPIYALTLARSDGKLGPKLSKSTDDCEKILAERRAAAVAARAGGAGPVPFTPPGPNEKPVCTINMRPTPVPNGPPLLTFKAGGQTLQSLVSQVSSFLNKRVVDRTGLTGLYDFELQFSMGTQMPLTTQAPGAGGAATTAPIDDGPTMFDAVRELGLKLESERGPVEHLVIDNVERPTED
ncbi:MAG TPA: TIGR03435 family protein [Vicinamibacterales bacterium]|nr:TIGR03435 family protein [Vicinamibacterales bacterium]